MKIRISLIASLLMLACGPLSGGGFPTLPAVGGILASETPDVILVTATPLPAASSPSAAAEASPLPALSPVPPSATSIPPTNTATPIPSNTPFVQVSDVQPGCDRPPDDKSRADVGDGMILNNRTVWMLAEAQRLYGGSHKFMQAITQGSYTADESASFGTHDGGGAVDLSVRQIGNYGVVLYNEFPAIILALRRAGFAAWVREVGELYDNSPIHIHAIAIGDPELSESAQRQLTGPEGYFRGFNGLPIDPPGSDKWGDPVICDWMIEMGYSDLRNGG